MEQFLRDGDRFEFGQSSDLDLGESRLDANGLFALIQHQSTDEHGVQDGYGYFGYSCIKLPVQKKRI